MVIEQNNVEILYDLCSDFTFNWICSNITDIKIYQGKSFVILMLNSHFELLLKRFNKEVLLVVYKIKSQSPTNVI